MTLLTRINISIDAVETIAGDLDRMESVFNAIDPFVLTDGSGANQANKKWADTRSLGIGATETLDLNALTDSASRTQNFAKIKALLIVGAPGNTDNIIVGNAATNPFIGPFIDGTWEYTLRPGAAMLLFDPSSGGWSSANGVSDKLLISNALGAAAVTYDIRIVGSS